MPSYHPDTTLRENSSKGISNPKMPILNMALIILDLATSQTY